jgi:hypothetical protein
MAAEELQRLADATEADTAERYVRQQRLAVVIGEAVRRADALARLDASLALAEKRSAA